MWVLQDVVIQYVLGIVFCTVIFVVWKLTHRGEKL